MHPKPLARNATAGRASSRARSRVISANPDVSRTTLRGATSGVRRPSPARLFSQAPCDDVLSVRCLHVAALPFPSPQGTQAAIRAMLDALVDAGHETHLLTYAHGQDTRSFRFNHHRANGPSLTQSMRSGPSLAKIGQGLALAKDVRALVRTIAPDVVIAHHVEAAIVCAGLSCASAFVAHTALEWELASYLKPAFAGCASAAGRAADGMALHAHGASAAIAPALADHLKRTHRRAVRYLPLPWNVAAESTALARDAARAHYGLARDAHVIAYLGNLDLYQGLPQLLEAFTRVHRVDSASRLVIATASDQKSVAHAIDSHPARAQIVVLSLGEEESRVRVHALADVIAVPRAIQGGVPVKLLDAFARGKAVVTVERAVAQLRVEESCVVCPNDDVDAFSSALVELLRDDSKRESLARNARAYLESAHNDRVFLAAFDALCDDALHHGKRAAWSTTSASVVSVERDRNSAGVHQP